nr:Ig-like domain repeat protein [Diaminobutyricibacter tongyongensis]
MVDCVSSAPGAAPDAFTVVFGYRNSSAESVALTPGAAQNTFSLGRDRGQPSTFDPGVHHAVFATTFAGAAGDLAWTLGGSTVAVDPGAAACETATTVTISAPPTAASGDPVDVTATVQRMLLGAPGAGTVEFSLDSSDTTVAATVNADGVARASVDAPGPGTHTITARYVPPTATPQLLGSVATASFAVTRASAISIASAGLSADSRSARFIVSRTATDAAAHVDYVTADGSARSGLDYASSRGTVRFAAGQGSATVAIPLLDRAFGSPGASFYVLLQRASETVEVAGATAVLPQVTAIATRPPGQASAGIRFVRPPQVPPAAAVAAPAVGSGRAGGPGDLALMIGGLLLTVGAASGVIGMMRLRSSGEASEL